MVDVGTWEEINNLAVKLKNVQKKVTNDKISIRNIVEILNLLLENNQIQLIYTNDGKELMTHEYLETQVYDEINASGGRIELVELSNTINVDLAYIKTAIDKIMADPNNSNNNNNNFHLIDGQILTNYYLSQIVAEINEKLQVLNKLDISDIVSNFRLPYQFITKIIQHDFQHLINGSIDNTAKSLCTHLYINQKRAIFNGIFASISRPCSIHSICSLHKINQNEIMDYLNEINGSSCDFILSNTVIIPHKYYRKVEKYIDETIETNDYLDYKILAKLNLPNIQSMIQTKKDLTSFTNLAFKTDRLMQMGQMIEESIRTCGFCDISTQFANFHFDEDLWEIYNFLVKKLSFLKEEQCKIIETQHKSPETSSHELFIYVYSPKILKNMLHLIQPYLVDLATKHVNEHLEKMAKSYIESISSKKMNSEKNSSKNRTTKENSKTKNKPKKSSQRSKTCDSEETTHEEENLAGQIDELFVIDLDKDMSLQFLIDQRIEIDIPLIDYLYHEISKKLHNELFKITKEIFLANLSAIQSTDSKDDSKKNENKFNLLQFEKLYYMARAFSNSFNYLPKNALEHTNKHLCKTIGNDLLKLLLRKTFEYESISPSSMIENDGGILTEDQVKTMMDKINGLKIKTGMENVAEQLKINNFVGMVESIGSLWSIQAFNDLNLKKFNIQLLESSIKEYNCNLMEKIKAANDNLKANSPNSVPILVHSAIQLLFSMNFKDVALNCPSRCVPSIIEHLKSSSSSASSSPSSPSSPSSMSSTLVDVVDWSSITNLQNYIIKLVQNKPTDEFNLDNLQVSVDQIIAMINNK